MDEFNWQQWWDLREIVLDAANGKASPLINAYSSNPIAAAADIYLRDRQNSRVLDDAARSLADLKPGVDPAVRDQYWLVLEKS